MITQQKTVSKEIPSKEEACHWGLNAKNKKKCVVYKDKICEVLTEAAHNGFYFTEIMAVYETKKNQYGKWTDVKVYFNCDKPESEDALKTGTGRISLKR